jgi:hypothetical protein
MAIVKKFLAGYKAVMNEIYIRRNEPDPRMDGPHVTALSV